MRNRILHRGPHRRRLGVESLESRRLLASGQFDPTFSDDGRLLMSPNERSFLGDVAIQSDGKIVVAGSSGPLDSSRNQFTLARLHPDGSLDTSFDGDGQVFTSFGSLSSGIAALAIQDNGKIIAAGSVTGDAGSDFALARYLPNGSLDTRFGVGGKVTSSIHTHFEYAAAITLQDDGKIVIAGSTFVNSREFFAVLRYLPDGTPDSSFGGDGNIVTAFAGGGARATSLAVDSLGRIVVAGGYLSDAGEWSFAVARYRPDGRLDPFFNQGGKLVGDFGVADSDANDVLLMPGNRILVVGNHFGPGDSDFAMARLYNNGTFDTTFGGDGKVVTPISNYRDVAFSAALQPNGKIVVAGRTYPTNQNGAFGLARYHPNGSLDTTFNGDGKAIGNVPGVGIGSAEIALQSDGNMVVGGEANTDPGWTWAIARFDGSAAPRTITLSNNTVQENQPAGTLVGVLRALDDDPGDTFTYSLVSGPGGEDNDSFRIVNSTLRTRFPLDYETKNLYSVRVRCVDSHGNSRLRIFKIHVEDVDETPLDIGSLSGDVKRSRT